MVHNRSRPSRVRRRRRGDRPALARPGQPRLGHHRAEHQEDEQGADRRAGLARHVLRRLAGRRDPAPVLRLARRAGRAGHRQRVVAEHLQGAGSSRRRQCGRNRRRPAAHSDPSHPPKRRPHGHGHTSSECRAFRPTPTRPYSSPGRWSRARRSPAARSSPRSRPRRPGRRGVRTDAIVHACSSRAAPVPVGDPIAILLGVDEPASAAEKLLADQGAGGAPAGAASKAVATPPLPARPRGGQRGKEHDAAVLGPGGGGQAGRAGSRRRASPTQSTPEHGPARRVERRAPDSPPRAPGGWPASWASTSRR